MSYRLQRYRSAGQASVPAAPAPASNERPSPTHPPGGAADLGQITQAVKRRLKQIQYRPDLVDACIAATELIPDG
ncbi:hypothetical protein ABZ865_24585 [Streptomyces sp. NPDC047085]|uniref:hypothetical protein n=1 Tax=Streptomyces sp. NPDC047085 TaxID=3155140 RepID=UPI0034108189